MAKHSVTDNGDLLKYYAAIPNIVFDLGLNPYEIALYTHFKRAAGNRSSGVCWKSRATIAKETGMSAGMVTKARQALEAPRPELHGRPLITVSEEASKTGGKPTCRITISDIWAVNMSKFSPSPHDIAPSLHDVEVGAPSPHDEQRHTVTIATSPHVPKEEPLKKNTEEEEKKEPSAHALLMDFHNDHLAGPIPDAAAQGGALKWLLVSYAPTVLRECYEYQLGEGWRSKVSWLTVKTDIGNWITRNGNGKNNELRRPTAAERNGEQLIRNIEFAKGLRGTGS